METRQAILRGLTFLEGQRTAAGWTDFTTRAGSATFWPTAYVLAQLGGLRTGEFATHPVFQGALQALQALRRAHRSDGGWGYNADVPSDADTTAWAALALARWNDAAAGTETRDVAIDSAGRRLARHQSRRGGGVATYHAPNPIRRFIQMPPGTSMAGWCQPHLSVTATTGRAWLGCAAPFDTHAMNAWAYVRGQQSEDGSWSGYWWADDAYPTLQAVALGLAVTSSDRKALVRAAAWLRRRLSSEAFWSTAPAFVQACCLSGLTQVLRLPALSDASHATSVAEAAARLVSSQSSDGSWPEAPLMRIPPPGEKDPRRFAGPWRTAPFDSETPPGSGIVIGDDRRSFTAVTCVSALTAARPLLQGI